MELLDKIKERYDWKRYLIASIIVSCGAFFIHISNNNPPQFDKFFMWLPSSWFMVLILMVGFTEVFGGEK